MQQVRIVNAIDMAGVTPNVRALRASCGAGGAVDIFPCQVLRFCQCSLAWPPLLVPFHASSLSIRMVVVVIVCSPLSFVIVIDIEDVFHTQCVSRRKPQLALKILLLTENEVCGNS